MIAGVGVGVGIALGWTFCKLARQATGCCARAQHSSAATATRRVVVVQKPEELPEGPASKDEILVCYWNIRGLAQPIRLALELAGAKYVDVRIEAGPAGSPEYKTAWTRVVSAAVHASLCPPSAASNSHLIPARVPHHPPPPAPPRLHPPARFPHPPPHLVQKPSLGLPFANLPYMRDGDGTVVVQSNTILRHIARKFGLQGENPALFDQALDEASDFDNTVTRMYVQRQAWADCPDEVYGGETVRFTSKYRHLSIDLYVYYRDVYVDSIMVFRVRCTSSDVCTPMCRSRVPCR